MMSRARINRQAFEDEGRVRSIPRDLAGLPAFMAARRVMLCFGRGWFDLRSDRDAFWKENKLTFDPERQMGAMQ